MKDLMEIKPSKFGKGLFAKANIPAGTVIYRIKGKELTFEKTTRLKEKESHALQIDYDKYILCEPPFLFSNHSCHPNCAINTNFEMVTITDIRNGDELFWDYSTSMLERHWTMHCGCGAKSCRKVVTDFDLLPGTVQSFYLDRNLVFPFIAHFMRQQLAKSA